MSENFRGIVMLSALMAATEPNITPGELQKNCEKLAAEKFYRETANDEDRVDYRAYYNTKVFLYGDPHISYACRY